MCVLTACTLNPGSKGQLCLLLYKSWGNSSNSAQFRSVIFSSLVGQILAEYGHTDHVLQSNTPHDNIYITTLVSDVGVCCWLVLVSDAGVCCWLVLVSDAGVCCWLVLVSGGVWCWCLLLVSAGVWCWLVLMSGVG